MLLAQNKISKTVLLLLSLTCCGVFSGCDKGDGNHDAERELSIKEGDARATGSACRQSGRALEDCYTMNPTSQRASVFAGWRDMNDYMRENKMEEVKPSAASSAPVTDVAKDAASGKDKSADKK